MTHSEAMAIARLGAQLWEANGSDPSDTHGALLAACVSVIRAQDAAIAQLQRAVVGVALQAMPQPSRQAMH